MAAKKVQRAFALMAAMLFLLSSLGFTGAVIWQMIQENKQKKEETSVNEQAKLKGTTLQGFTPVKSVKSLQKIDTVEGTGDVVKPGATVTANYTGALADTGVIFESSLDNGQPVTFPLDKVIKGWSEGVPGMKVGGKRRLVIPANKAYGATAREGIPANSDLVFDIEIISAQ